MQTGTYKTTDPNVRIRVEQDDNFHDDPHYAEGVREALLEAHEAGDVYGVILQKRETWARFTENSKGDVTLHDCEERWVDEESIWACAGYENVAEEVAKTYFGITVTGRE